MEQITAKSDAECKKSYILGDINCNLLPEANADISSFLTNILCIYGLSQLIKEHDLTRKANYTVVMVLARLRHGNLSDFDRNKFLSDLNQMPRANVDLYLNCQLGFCSLHSTLTALVETTNDWSVNIDNGLLNGVVTVFIDLSKAFDTTDHEIILRKMSFLGFDQAAIRWFLSYLSGRTQRCDVNGKLYINCSRFQVRRTAEQYIGSFAACNLYYN